MTQPRALALLAVLGAVLAGCGSSGDSEVVVSAASSLTDAFTEIAREFEAGHPAVTVTLNFASSSALAAQIVEGAPVDVFASANEQQMDIVISAGRATRARAFASNRLVVVRPAGSSTVLDFADLGAPGRVVVLASPEAPVGAYAQATIDRAATSRAYGADFAARVSANVRSRESNVRAVLAKVQLGEADAGIVYATDAAAAAGAVDTIPIPPELLVPVTYPVAVLSDAANPGDARGFVDFVLGAEGQSILGRYGFTAP